jgi:hypothetical protein
LETVYPVAFPEEWKGLAWESLDPMQLSVVADKATFLHAGGDRCADVHIFLKNQPAVGDTFRLFLQDSLQGLDILSPSATNTLEAGLRTYPFRVKFEPLYAAEAVLWSASDTSVLEIDSLTGFAVAHRAGSVEVCVRSLSHPHIADTLKLEVSAPPAPPAPPAFMADSIVFSRKASTISPLVKTIEAGDTLELTAHVFLGGERRNCELVWSLLTMPDLIAEWIGLPDGNMTVAFKALSVGQVRLEAVAPDGSAAATLDLEVVHPKTTALSPEPSAAAPSAVKYAGGQIALSGLAGCRVTVASLTGKVVAAFAVETGVFRRQLTLPAGIYLLHAEKQGSRTAVKFKVSK